MTALLAQPAPRGTSSPLDDDDREPSLRGVVGLAMISAVALCVGVGGWSLYARLDSAAVAPGVIAVKSHRKTVQHLEGGILHTMLVRDGEFVKAGQPLAILDATQAESQRDQLLHQLVTVRARIARLEAEQAGRRDVDYAAEDVANPTQRIRDAIAVQSRLFDARWRAHDSAIQVISKRIAQLESKIASEQSQLAASEVRRKLYEEELAAVSRLFSQGYERRPRMLELQRQVADLQGNQGDLRNAIAADEEAIASARIEIENLEQVRMSEINKELEQALAQKAEYSDRIRWAEDVVKRREVVSPQDGVVVDLRMVTPGGVLGQGEPIMDIVPIDDELIVETRVGPEHIDVVTPGLPARVRLSAYKATWAPEVEGVVDYVSADLLKDARTNESYFLTRIRLFRESLGKYKGVKPTPGMPAEVMIVTGNRRAIEYFLAPITDRLRGAFRED